MLDEALDFMEAASAPVIQRLAWNHPPHDPVRWQCRNWRWTARICSRMTGEILTSTCFNKACCLVFWNFWELWFVCFANSLTCGAKKMRRNHFFWGGVCPIPKLPEAIEFSRMPPDFFDSRNLLRFFFFLWNLGCDQIASTHQYFSKRIKVTTAVGNVPIFGIQVDPLRLISIQGILVSSRQTSRLESLEPPNDLLQSMEEVIRRGIPGCV